MASLVKTVAPRAEVVEFDTVTELLDAAAKSTVTLALCGTSTGAALSPNWIRECADAVRPGKLVVLSASLDRLACERAQRSGAWGHLPMTSSTELMGAAIRLILAGGTFFPALQPMAVSAESLAETAGLGARLSRRQLQVLAEIEEGLSNKDIATNLGISVPTVKLHVQAILKALGAKNRTEAARMARDQALTD